MLTIAADLSESVNLEHGSLWGHYDPEKNRGTRLKADSGGGERLTAIGPSARTSVDEVRRRVGVERHGGAFTPLILPARVWSQQNQDSKFRTGVLHILAGHSGPATAADARTHFRDLLSAGLKLFPGQPSR
jgi:hypothetical protein